MCSSDLVGPYPGVPLPKELPAGALVPDRGKFRSKHIDYHPEAAVFHYKLHLAILSQPLLPPGLSLFVFSSLSCPFFPCTFPNNVYNS